MFVCALTRTDMYHEIRHHYFKEILKREGMTWMKTEKRKELTFDRRFDHKCESYFDGKDFDESDVVWKRQAEQMEVVELKS